MSIIGFLSELKVQSLMNFMSIDDGKIPPVNDNGLVKIRQHYIGRDSSDVNFTNLRLVKVSCRQDGHGDILWPIGCAVN